MIQILIVVVIAFAIWSLERFKPNVDLSKVNNWYQRAFNFNGAQAVIAAVSTLLWDVWFAKLSFISLSSYTIETQVLSGYLTITSSGNTLHKSAAVIHCLELLGGVWFLIAMVMKIVPGVIRDKCYDFVGFVRYKIAGKVDINTCQLLPGAYRSKILP